MIHSNSASIASRTSISSSASVRTSAWGHTSARAELQSMFGLLLERMEWFEQAGPLERLNSSINGAIKHLPIRYRLA